MSENTEPKSVPEWTRHPLFIRSASLLLGGALPVIAFLAVTGSGVFSHGGENDDAFKPGSAVEAVSSRLPQVAILGQKAGPSGMTEVFVQVPGVMDMQSVYVINDGETVISGVVLPKLTSGGVPGGQLTMPDGQVKVDPTGERPELNAMVDMLRGNDAQELPADQASQVEPSTRTGLADIPAPIAPVNPPMASADRQPQTGSIPSPSNAPQQGLDSTTESISSPSDLASQPADPEPAGIADSSAGESVLADGGGPSVMVDINDEKAFQDAVRSTVQTSSVVQGVRSQQGEQAQQRAYLDAVRSMPAIQQGDGPRDLYVFFDPNCPVCHALYQDVAVDVASGDVTVHWIPAIVFSDEPSSITSSAMLLAELEANGNRSALGSFVRMMRDRSNIRNAHQSFTEESHGRFVADVIESTALMVVARAETPLLVFENEQGSLVIDRGVPAPGYIDQIAKK